MSVHAPASPGLAQIGQIAIAVKDLPGAVAFYRDVLGLPFLFEAPPKLAFFDCAGVRLMLSEPEKPEFDHPASIIYYRVMNMQETVEDAEPRSVDGLPARSRAKSDRADERGRERLENEGDRRLRGVRTTDYRPAMAAEAAPCCMWRDAFAPSEVCSLRSAV
jgi:catechol 2,3-dioxygenase-like lactoylglutathione lyase family enzyme